jgi:hypothetical protein
MHSVNGAATQTFQPFFCSGTILGPGVGKFADGIGQNVCFENYYYMSLNMDIHLSAAAVTEVEMKFGDAICVRLWHGSLHLLSH